MPAKKLKGKSLAARRAAARSAVGVLHDIRVKLYPNHLPNVEGQYIARTSSEAVLGIERVCASLKRRGRYDGDYDKLVENVRQYFDEAASQLCEGYAISTGYFSVQPSVSGTFGSPQEAYDPARNPVAFRFRILSKLSRLVDFISVEVNGLAKTSGYISDFTDISTGTINETVSAGGQFIITGSKLKIASDGSEDCGIFFQPLADPGRLIKTPGHLAENSASRLIGVAPPLPPGPYRIAIVTQYNGTSGTFLKQAKTLASGFELACQ